MQFQDPVVVTPEVHKISETREVSCTCVGRPIPTLDWSYANTALEENHKIFSANTLQDSTTRTATSVFQIVNPISFDHDFSLMCKADLSGSNTGIIKINSGMRLFTLIQLINDRRFHKTSLLFVYKNLYQIGCEISRSFVFV